MKPVCVYKAIFGGYDIAQPILKDKRFDFNWIHDNNCEVFTDGISAFPAEQKNRYFKYSPPEEMIRGSDINVYLDGSLNILDWDLLYELCRKLYKSEYDIMMPESKYGNNMLLECLAVVREDKAMAAQIYKQVHDYVEKGFVDKYTTVSAGFQIRRTGSRLLRRFLDKWYSEIVKWRTRDQIAYPYVLWKTGYKGVKVFGNSVRNRLFEKLPHVGEVVEK